MLWLWGIKRSIVYSGTKFVSGVEKLAIGRRIVKLKKKNSKTSKGNADKKKR